MSTSDHHSSTSSHLILMNIVVRPACTCPIPLLARSRSPSSHSNALLILSRTSPSEKQGLMLSDALRSARLRDELARASRVSSSTPPVHPPRDASVRRKDRRDCNHAHRPRREASNRIPFPYTSSSRAGKRANRHCLSGSLA